MRTLILCVDRDDDFGVKAGTTSPIIGRKDNLRAAISLGLKDPEDSDTNSLFAAIQLYDQYRDSEQDVEIATLCGNTNVGTKSDRIISIQLETVLEMLKPDHVVMVSDGAEDEFILPMISSRIKIDSIKRVIIRQQKNIEGTFYFIAKAIQDERIRKNIMIPLSLILLIWGLCFIFNYVGYGVGATLITLGLYILIRALHLEEPAILVGRDIRDALQSGKYVLAMTTLVAIGILALGLYQGWLNIRGAEQFPLNILVFLEGTFIYFIGAFLIYVLGKTLDTYLRTGEVLRTSISIITSTLAAWFIFLAIIHIFKYFFQLETNFNFSNVLFNIFLGGFIGFISIEVYYYIKQHFPEGKTQAQD